MAPTTRPAALDATISAVLGAADDAADALTATVMDASLDATGVEAASSHRAPYTSTIRGLESASTSRTTVLPGIDLKDAQSLVVHQRSRYEKVKLLGEGAMGEVELARDNDIERDVALKRLKPKVQGDPASVLRFVDEIRLVGRLEHPNIVPVHDVGVDESGALFFVMKRVVGDTLEDIIKKLAEGDPETHERFTFTVRTQIFLDILRAVEYAHGMGVIHRDIKPANVMVGPTGEAVLMDWGLARGEREEGEADEGRAAVDLAETAPAGDEAALSPLAEGSTGGSVRRRLYQTRHGSLLGTPAYMSPEQAMGEVDAIDERSDIYALGVLLYEFLTLRHYLSDANTLNAMLFGVANKAPVFPTLLDHPHQRRIPSELGHFIMMALAKEPAERFQSAAEMMAELQRALRGEFDILCPATMIKRGGHGVLHAVDRNPVTLTIVVFGVAIASLVGLVSLAVTLFS